MSDTKDHIIYMDNAATVRLKDKALAAMMPYLKDSYYNPGGAYDPAQSVRRDAAAARETIASTLNGRPTEIFFTSGGTESDNQALRGPVSGRGDGPVCHIITTAFEHHAILNTCRYLERTGQARVSYVNPKPSGLIDPSDVEKLIDRDTVLISVMTVNNELGTVQPVSDIGRIAHEHGVLFHTDAVAAYGHIPIDVRSMNIDLMSVSAHKFGGPKGTGFLYVRENLKLPPLIFGGSQERGRRAGTENVPGIIGMAAAAEDAHAHMEENLKKRRMLDEYLLNKHEELKSISAIRINGENRIPGHFNMTIPGSNAEELVVKLGMKGICISAGAACTSSNDEESHVLRAIGLKGDALRSTVRISMNGDNTKEEIDLLLEEIR